MKYQIYHLKMEQLVSYFKDRVIDLTPAFQRGRVWTPKMRRGLLKNILQGKPVPAIFLYKKATGARNFYIILDGKQRLESILLYIASQRDDLHIPGWKSYFFTKKEKQQAGFKADVDGKQKSLGDLTNEEVLKFRDYLLSIIEIDFDESSTLDEMIQLFVDINLYGIKVKRFDIVKALYLKDPLLSQIFDLIAIKQERGKDTYYKMRQTSFSRVLRNLDIVERVHDSMNKVDIMWEKLFELALFTSTQRHRKPVQILKEFISRQGDDPRTPKLSRKEVGLLENVFRFIARAYESPNLDKTRWATDQTHFYIFVTTLINKARKNLALDPNLVRKLIRFDALLNGSAKPSVPAKTQDRVKEYIALSAKQTTDVSKRQQREKLFGEILQAL